MLSALLLVATLSPTPGYVFDLEAPASANEAGWLLQPLAQRGDLSQLDADPKLKALPRVRTFHDETRVFWYAAGAGSVTSLATRVVLSIPAGILLFSNALAGAGLAGPTALAVFIGTVALFTVIDSALSALASTMVFNNMSRFYEVDWLSGFMGQLAGNALSGSVFWLTFGFGGLSLLGIESLGGIVAGTLLQGMQTFSVLGAMPAVVISFLASLALPSLISTWTLAATAKPRDNYRIDPTWEPYGRRGDRIVLPDPRQVATTPIAIIPLPGT